MEICKLSKRDKCVFAVKMAERASLYFEDTKTVSLINNAIGRIYEQKKARVKFYIIF